MPTDISRDRFDPSRDYTGVVLQQGRVLLDSEANEQADIVDRRFRATTFDAFGVTAGRRAIVPRTTPDGFRITRGGDTLLIGVGRAYVDGLLVECHGASVWEFDERLGETRGTKQIPIDAQPFLPDAPAPPGGGRALVYLEAWQRDVTPLEQEDLVEPALGFDTTARRQTVWQVKFLDKIPADADCSTLDEDIPAWLELIQPPGGRLTTSTIEVPPADDPCLLPPGGGYRGLEHRLYRVEIHDGGAPGKARFKWARHNATIAAIVTRIDGTRLGVDRLRRDAEMSFRDGDWVEVTDERRMRRSEPGEMRRITVDAPAGQLVLSDALPPGEFPVEPAAPGDPSLRPRWRTIVRRWDQRGVVRDVDGNVLEDLDAGPIGTIPVPELDTTRVVLEDGVAVSFSMVAPAWSFKRGDYWLFAARTATDTTAPSIDILHGAPPRGIHRHFARLAMISAGGAIGDCRVTWPPVAESGGHDGACGCMVCVDAKEHAAGVRTVQQAIDMAVAGGGGIVCLGPGTFHVAAPGLRVVHGRSITIRGHGSATVVVCTGDSPTLAIAGQCVDIRIERLCIVGSGHPGKRAATVLVSSGVDLAMHACIVEQVDPVDDGPPAIGLAGPLLGLEITDCRIVGAAGVSNLLRGGKDEKDVREAPLLTVGLRVKGNVLSARRAAIDLGESCIHGGDTTIAENLIFGGDQHGIRLVGTAARSDGVDVRHNRVMSDGDGIVCSIDGAVIAGNRVTGARRGEAAGIRVMETSARDRLERCIVSENFVERILGDGIVVDGRVGDAAVRGNVVQGVSGAGIRTGHSFEGGTIVIADNQLRRIGGATGARGVRGAILVAHARRAQVRGNAIADVGRRGDGAPLADDGCRGIAVGDCAAIDISDNVLELVGPDAEFKTPIVAIEADALADDVAIARNTVNRLANAAHDTPFVAIRIGRMFEDARGGDDDTRVAGAHGAMIMVRSAGVVVAPARAPGAATVADNRVAQRGLAPAIDVEGPATVNMSGNVARIESPAKAPVARIAKVRAVSVTGNTLQGPKDGDVLEVDAPTKCATVVGNAATGRLMVNGQPVLWTLVVPAPEAPGKPVEFVANAHL